MDNKLKGKVAIVTGGASGIGKQICKTFADQGAIVCILDINTEKADEISILINKDGGRSESFSANVSLQHVMEEITSKIMAKYGKIDILINNAGIAHVGNLERTNEAAFDRVYNVNIKGVYNGLYAVIPQMVKQKSGIVLNMGSIASMIGLPDRFAYSMSKAAVENMTYTIARDYISFGIRCNAISPARVHTPFVDEFIKNNYPGKEKEKFDELSLTQPIGRMGKPEEIANLALYLCSDEASFITGTNFPIDGGFVKLNT